MFHMGGDEVNFQCWYQEKSIRDWMIKNHFEVNPAISPEGYLNLWSVFQEKALKKLVAANNGKSFKDGVLLWTSELTRPDKIYKLVFPFFFLYVISVSACSHFNDIIQSHNRFSLKL